MTNETVVVDVKELRDFLLSIEEGTEGMCPCCRDMQENRIDDGDRNFIHSIPFPDGRKFKHNEDCDWLKMWKRYACVEWERKRIGTLVCKF